jgi:sec-independent protein translocase protein TatC
MKKPISSHVDELKRRLIAIIIFFIIFFFLGIAVSKWVVGKIITDLMPKLGVFLVVSSPFEFVLIMIKTGMCISLVITIPVILYNTIIFIKPALTKKEKKALKIILPASVGFLLAGILFGYFFFLEVVIPILAKQAADISILNLWNVNKFVSFTFLICLIFGFIFQLPLVMILLSKTGILTKERLVKTRKYAILAIFILSALITPPDVITLLVAAIVLLFLYEVGIVLVKLFG